MPATRRILTANASAASVSQPYIGSIPLSAKKAERYILCSYNRPTNKNLARALEDHIEIIISDSVGKEDCLT